MITSTVGCMTDDILKRAEEYLETSDEKCDWLGQHPRILVRDLLAEARMLEADRDRWKEIAKRERAKFIALAEIKESPDQAEDIGLRVTSRFEDVPRWIQDHYIEQAARELEGEAHLPIAPHGIVERNENPTIEMTPERQEAFGVALERLAATATDDKYISNPWMIGRVEQAIEILREMLGGEQPRKWKNEGNSR